MSFSGFTDVPFMAQYEFGKYFEIEIVVAQGV